jgi:hypothetical protein
MNAKTGGRSQALGFVRKKIIRADSAPTPYIVHYLAYEFKNKICY